MNETAPRKVLWSRFWPSNFNQIASAFPGMRGRVRLRTLSNLRWLAIAGQSATLFIVYFGLNYHLPLFRCVIVIATSVALNVFLAIRYEPSHRLTSREATGYLAYDV